MIPIQLILLSIVTFGYLSKRLGVLSKDDARPFSVVLLNIMLPALIIVTFSKVDISGQLGLMSLSAFFILSILLLIGWIFGRSFVSSTRKTTTMLMGTYWGATLAFPFVLGVYGEEGFRIFAFYDIVQALFMSTVIPWIADRHVRFAESLKNLLKNPLFLSFVIALMLNFLDISSAFVDELFTLISNGIVFMGLLIVGLNLELRVDQYARPLAIIATKIIVGAVLGFSLVHLFGFSGLYVSILILAATLPPSLMVMILSQKYELDTSLAANTLTLSLPISIFVMTLISIYL